MARSVSRPHKGSSKSPARVKKVMMSPKSEPKKKKAEKVKGASRSRSASRGRKSKQQIVKSPPNSINRSASRGRLSKAGRMSPKKLSSSPKKHSPEKPEKSKTQTTKTPSLKIASLKTPAEKTPAVKTLPIKASSLSMSSARPSRSVERKAFSSMPIEPEFRQRFLRPESSSRSPVKVTPKKASPYAFNKLYNRTCGTVNAAGRTVYNASRAACRSVLQNRREILVTFILLALVVLITYFIFYTDPAKTRAFIHSIPGKIQAWYRKHVVRK